VSDVSSENAGEKERALRLVIADDHTMLREGLRRSLEARGIDVVGEASDGAEAVRLTLDLKPDVVLMDVSMPAMDGVEATRQIRQQMPDASIVMLTMHADHVVLVRALRAGASGYLVKDCTTDEIVNTIRQAAGGDTTVSAGVAAAMLAQAKGLMKAEPMPLPASDEAIISKREEEVLQLIAEGASTTEVAARLYISVKTVKNHLASIYQKLDSRDRTQAVVRAVKMGIIRIR
jgi:two-component system, NarL family, response regulator DegU